MAPRRRATRLPFVLAALLLAAPAAAAPERGETAPDFTLRDRSGAVVNLAELAYPGDARRGRPKNVVLLDFFRTDCAPCVKAMPHLKELHRRFAGKPVRLIMVALLEEEEGAEKLERFLAEQDVRFTVLVDAYAVAAKKYVFAGGVARLPSLFVIDRNRVVRERAGALDDAGLERLSTLVTDLAR